MRLDDGVPEHGLGLRERIENREGSGKVVKVGIEAYEVGGDGDGVGLR